MIFDELIEEILGDISSAGLEDLEDVDGSVFVPRNIRLFDEEDYRFFGLEARVEPKPFICVDGGNAEVMGYGGFVVEYNKVVGFDSFGGRLGPYKFLSLTRVAKGFVETKIYHKERALGFAPKQLEPKAMRLGEAYSLTGRARRVMEQLFAAQLVSERGPEMVVLDGSLGHTNDRAEIDALDTLFERAREQGAVVAALAKTTSITRMGEPITQRASRLARQRGLRHFYVEVGWANRGSRGYRTRLFVVRLNSLAKKAYLLEVYDPSGPGDVSGLVYSLASNSNSVALPGYPQGLVWADRHAHVSVEEVEHVKIALTKHTDNPIVAEAFAHRLLDSLG